MKDGVAVRVPGTTSNLGSGFDCVGIAIERWIEFTARRAGGRTPPVAIERGGTLTALALPPERDLLYIGLAAACRAARREVPEGLALTATSDIPVGRGLGASAAALVAGAVAANALLDLGLGDDALATLCTDIEGHPDNVAPAIYGGAVLVVRDPPPAAGLTVTALEVHAGLVLVFAVPDFTVETERARAALPASVPHATAAAAAARSAALVHGLARAHPGLLALGLDDLLHVPYRRPLVPGYDQVTAAARRAGAFGATLSGSGSTVVAVAAAERASAVEEAMALAWRGLGVATDTFRVARPAGGYHIQSARC